MSNYPYGSRYRRLRRNLLQALPCGGRIESSSTGLHHLIGTAATVAIAATAIFGSYVSWRLYSVTSAQVQLQRDMADTQQTLAALSKAQIQLTENQVELQKQLAVPTAKYVRRPHFVIGKGTRDPHGPLGENYRHSYPDESYFTSETGVASIKSVSALHFGWLILTDACRLENGRTSIEVRFRDLFVYGQNQGVRGDIRATYVWLVRPGLKNRVSDAVSRIDQLLPGCVKDARIYGAYRVKLVDIRSEKHVRFFEGYLRARLNPESKEGWETALKRWKRGKCDFGLAADDLANCVAAIKAESEFGQ